MFIQSYFRQSFDAILEDVPVAETIFECYTINFKTIIFQRSKYYVSTTLLTKLKVASNMADLISTIHSDSTLNGSQLAKLKKSIPPMLLP